MISDSLALYSSTLYVHVLQSTFICVYNDDDDNDDVIIVLFSQTNRISSGT